LRYSLRDDLQRQKVSTREVMDFAGELKKRLRFNVRTIDLGGGSFRPVPRREGFGPGMIREGPTISQYADTIISAFAEKIKEYDLGNPVLINEVGGGLVSDSTVLLTTVGRIKGVKGGPRLVGLDASAYTFVRKLIFPTFYFHPVVANKINKPADEEVILVGQICAHDALTPYIVKVPKLERGDIVAIMDQGAYSQSISTQYCAIPRPATAMISGDSVDIIVERETVDYMTMNNHIPDRYIEKSES
jgi:diaminopimelate decarboxylase